ncbi:putative porin [Acidovorax soli]|uniref:Putative porin n=1 Tax=Acidovorax soli TaxID=592050 RepID=A0A7X0PJD6_9BURK|nr:porin [Acidovorax soli]MBB6562657.1 putative porin [Acidovorax soli]
MKLKPLALAALTLAAAAGAQAQSSVTLFGVVDASLVRMSSDTNSVTGLSSGGQSSSRLGFRGVEDLGGGLKAGFWLEGGLATDNGTAAGFRFDRRSTVSISGGFGEVRLGRDKSPAYLNIETFDPFGDSGVGGNNGANMVGSASSAAGTPEGSAPKRTSNGLNYLLPEMGGFYGQLQYALGEQPSNQVNKRMGNSLALRAGYANGPLNVAVAFGETRGGVATASSVDYKASNVGVSYSFGVVKPMALFATERGAGRRVDMFTLGATVPLGVGELRASYVNFKRKDVNNADSQKFAIGYGHNLSKRTQLYATVARISNDRAATRGLAVSSSSLGSPTIGAGNDVTGYEFGVRHIF